MSSRLPVKFSNWFQAKGWSAYPHQLQMIEQIESGKSILLIAPTGAGKTLSGFLPSLIDLAETPHQGLHTLYLSPIKALAVDIARNLDTPISEMGLPITVETRTGDTPQAKRNRQRTTPPNMLMTTPESLELMLSWPDAARLFGSVKMIIIDEIHALAGTKRGDLLSLSLAALRKLAPHSLSIGLSATVANPDRFTPWLDADQSRVAVLKPDLSKAIELSILDTEAERLPWSGHGGLYAAKDIYTLITTHRPCLVFVNTRAQAEMLFQALWVHNDLTLKIGLHHGSLEVGLRRKTEAAMARGELDAVVATSSLDLGIDWADIELVIQVGAPKGTSRLMQRIGRAGHRLDAPSRALIVPANRFEVLESLAAKINVEERILDDLPEHDGGLTFWPNILSGERLPAPLTRTAFLIRCAARHIIAA